jgi:hypothetical protein
MPPVGFEPRIAVLERAKTVRDLDRAATAIGRHRINAHRTHTQTSMPPVGFEPRIAVLERAKTVRALDAQHYTEIFFFHKVYKFPGSAGRVMFTLPYATIAV